VTPAAAKMVKLVAACAVCLAVVVALVLLAKRLY
jgi:hypothetical protein